MFTYPIKEANRGGISVVIRQVTMNRLHQMQRVIRVPWTNKELKLRWEHIVSKLEPGVKESWTAVVEGAGGEAAVAEMVATMYDASLDAFAGNRFQTLMGVLRSESGTGRPVRFSSSIGRFSRMAGFDSVSRFSMGSMFRGFRNEFRIYDGGAGWGYGWFSESGLGGGGAMRRRGGVNRYYEKATDASPEMEFGMVRKEGLRTEPAAAMALAENMDFQTNSDGFGDGDGAGLAVAQQNPDVSQVTARKNLQETAFFYPTLISDADGKVRVSFTMPEALTKWRFLGMAHDANFRSGLLEGETVMAKDLMVQPNPPRFLREGDVLEFTVKVTNQSEKEQSGTARLTLADAATDKDRTAAMGIESPDQKFTVPAKESRTLNWKIAVPDGAGFLKYKAVAATGDLTDGEEGWLPVISRRT